MCGGWHRGIPHEKRDYLPLTTDVLAAHLKGEMHVGVYPLLVLVDRTTLADQWRAHPAGHRGRPRRTQQEPQLPGPHLPDQPHSPSAPAQTANRPANFWRSTLTTVRMLNVGLGPIGSLRPSTPSCILPIEGAIRSAGWLARCSAPARSSVQAPEVLSESRAGSGDAGRAS